MFKWLKQLFYKDKVLVAPSGPIQLGPCHVLKDGKPLFKCENALVDKLGDYKDCPTINLIMKKE